MDFLSKFYLTRYLCSKDVPTLVNDKVVAKAVVGFGGGVVKGGDEKLF
jgi:hypothetical protein